MISKSKLQVLVASFVFALSSCGYSRFVQIPTSNKISPASPTITIDQFHYQVGVAKAIITPPHNTWLAGFNPIRSATGVHDNLEIRVLSLVDPSGKIFSFITADFIGFMYTDYLRLKQLVNISNINVFVFSSHTHSGPDMIGIWGALPFTSGRDENYINSVVNQMGLLVYESLSTLRQAEIYQSDISADGFSKNRREHFLDTTLSVLTFVNIETNHIIGTIVNFGCHPEVIKRKNRLISSDFVGSLRDELDRELDTTTLFINGALGGMVQPNMKWKDDEPFETRDKFGKNLANLAIKALTKTNNIPVGPINHSTKTIKIPLTNNKFWLAAILGFIPHREAVLSRIITTEVSVIKLGDFAIVAVPGEIVPELGLEIKRIGGVGTQTWSLANDEIGYILVKEKFFAHTFKYESTMSIGPDAGPIVMNAVEKLLKNR